MTKLLILDILFSTALTAILLPRLVIFGIPPLNSFILALRIVLVARLVMSSNLFLLFFILALYTSFLTALFFATPLILKSTGTGKVIIY